MLTQTEAGMLFSRTGAMTFADLTWEDLKEWAGTRVVGRGESYRRAV